MIRKIRSSTRFDKCRYVVGGTTNKNENHNLLSLDANRKIGTRFQKCRKNDTNVTIASEKRRTNYIITKSDASDATASQKRRNDEFQVTVATTLFQRRLKRSTESKNKPSTININQPSTNNGSKQKNNLASTEGHGTFEQPLRKNSTKISKEDSERKIEGDKISSCSGNTFRKKKKMLHF